MATDSWDPMTPLDVGAPVLIASGCLKGFDGVIAAIDRGADTVVVTVKVLGRPTSLAFSLSRVAEHLAPFGDQPPGLRYPHEETGKRDLLSLCPDADAVYRSDFWQGMTWFLVQIVRTGSDHRLIVQTLNITSPIQEKMRWATREIPLAATTWDDFRRLVEACDFWQLPYDDGHRVRGDKTRNIWQLEGCERDRYHHVVRSTEGDRADITGCCEFLQSLAEKPLHG